MLSPPGPGRYPSLATPAVYLLVAMLLRYVVMLFVLPAHHPNRRRGQEGYVGGWRQTGVPRPFGGARGRPCREGPGKGIAWPTRSSRRSRAATGRRSRSSGTWPSPGSRKQARWLIPSVVVAAVLFLAGFALTI